MAGDGYIGYPSFDERIRIGPPFLTKYERARIIGIRAYQIAFGVPPLVDPATLGTTNPVEIAKYEVDKGILPVSVYRYHSSGEAQAIPLRVLLEASRRLGISYD